MLFDHLCVTFGALVQTDELIGLDTKHSFRDLGHVRVITVKVALGPHFVSLAIVLWNFYKADIGAAAVNDNKVRIADIGVRNLVNRRSQVQRKSGLSPNCTLSFHFICQ
jgi:hypothetical protein